MSSNKDNRQPTDSAVVSAIDSGGIPKIETTLTRSDRWNSWKVRWGFNRMGYTVEPGLYAIGFPGEDSEVFVSANYKMSFDRLRSQLKGRDGWLLVLDTRGVNVWCAAGKGTFGTDEIVKRVKEANLAKIVNHRRLIVPQLGATGICAHEVKDRSGFRVVYGPIRAEDLPEFLDERLKATPEMRLVTFPFKERLILVPIELSISLRLVFLIMASFILLSGFGSDGYSIGRIKEWGFLSGGLFVGAWLWGAVMAPAMLPWLPGRSFSVKGAWVGVIYIILASLILSGTSLIPDSYFCLFSWPLIILAVTSYMAMNFTGASTYTSLSGVMKEMKVAVPLQIGFGAVGIGLWITGLFV